MTIWISPAIMLVMKISACAKACLPVIWRLMKGYRTMIAAFVKMSHVHQTLVCTVLRCMVVMEVIAVSKGMAPQRTAMTVCAEPHPVTVSAVGSAIGLQAWCRLTPSIYVPILMAPK